MAKNPELARLEDLLTRNRDVEKILEIGLRDGRPAEWTRGQIHHNFGINLTVHETMMFMSKWRSRRAVSGRLKRKGTVGADEATLAGPPIPAAAEPGAHVAEPANAGAMKSGEGINREIMDWSREKVRELLDMARADPDCDASKIVEIILLNATVSNQLKAYENDIDTLLAAQSRISDLVRKNKRLDIERYNADLRASNAETQRMEMEFKQSRILEEVQKAQTAIAQGKPFDAAEALQKFSDLAGLTGPPEQRVEP